MHHLDQLFKTAADMGWERLQNGDLLKASEELGFDVMVTCHRNLRYQQNLAGRKLAIVEITTNKWSALKPHLDNVKAAVGSSEPGSYVVVEISLPPKRKWQKV